MTATALASVATTVSDALRPYVTVRLTRSVTAEESVTVRAADSATKDVSVAVAVSLEDRAYTDTAAAESVVVDVSDPLRPKTISRDTASDTVTVSEALRS